MTEFLLINFVSVIDCKKLSITIIGGSFSIPFNGELTDTEKNLIMNKISDILIHKFNEENIRPADLFNGIVINIFVVRDNLTFCHFTYNNNKLNTIFTSI